MGPSWLVPALKWNNCVKLGARILQSAKKIIILTIIGRSGNAEIWQQNSMSKCHDCKRLHQNQHLYQDHWKSRYKCIIQQSECNDGQESRFNVPCGVSEAQLVIRKK